MKIIIGILGILLLANCQDNSTPSPNNFKTLMIKSQGEVEVLPDLAKFNIRLNCLDKSIKQSKNCLVEKSNELNEKLISFGIRQDDILTTSVDLNKSYTWVKGTRVFQGFNSATRMYVTIREIDKLDELYTELLENRNLDLSQLSYSHSKLDSLKNQAYVNALRKSKVLADNLLNELPESKREVLKIGNVKISTSTPQNDESGTKAQYKMAEASSSNNLVIHKGTVIVNATLFVEYQIK